MENLEKSWNYKMVISRPGEKNPPKSNGNIVLFAFFTLSFK